MPGYAVVAFDEGREVSAVPSNWLFDGENKCYWPPYRDSQWLPQAIKQGQDNWSKYTARGLSKCGSFSSFHNSH